MKTISISYIFVTCTYKCEIRGCAVADAEIAARVIIHSYWIKTKDIVLVGK